MALKLPAWVSRIQNGGNKLPASKINKKRPIRKVTIGGQNAYLPIIYGRARAVGGTWVTTPLNTVSDDLYCIAWAYGECQEIEAVYINDALSTSYAGVTVTNYLGTDSQTADATLSANIAGYNDDLPNIVYSVITIPHGTTGITGIPRVAATIKGRKVYDPRTDTTAYSDNSALCLADWLSNDVYGLGYTVQGVAECANFNDELIDGLERCKIGIIIEEPKPAFEYAELLAEYAECFIIWEGDDIRIRPDTAGDSIGIITDNDMSSLKCSLTSVMQAPTVTVFQYTKPLAGSSAWPIEPIELSLPSYTDRRVSNVTMDGVFREAEALRKCESRLRRAQLGTTFTFETFDDGLIDQIGDIKTIQSASRNIDQDVRITGIETIGAGRYRVHAALYSIYGYPDSVAPPSSTGQIYAGMILPLISGDVPTGYDLFSDADGRFIVGAGSTYAGDETGGSDTVTISGTTSTIPNHNGSAFLVRKSSTLNAPPNNIYPRDPSSADDGAHSHTHSDSATITQYANETKLVIKTGANSTTVPNNCAVFSNGAINNPQVSALTTHIGRALKAANDWAISGSQSQIKSITVDPDGAHDHGHGQGNTLIPSAPQFTSATFNDAPDHTHDIDLTLTPNIKRRKLIAYSGAEDFDVLPGFIVAYQLATAPDASWKLCDGTNNTPDLRDLFIEYATISNVDQTTGDNTVSWTGTSSLAGLHDHFAGTLTDDPYEVTTSIHSNNEPAHQHTASGSVAFVPPYYALYFYMYTG